MNKPSKPRVIVVTGASASDEGLLIQPHAEGRTFLDQLPLAPTDRAKLAHGNADRLLKLRDGCPFDAAVSVPGGVFDPTNPLLPS